MNDESLPSMLARLREEWTAWSLWEPPPASEFLWVRGEDHDRLLRIAEAAQAWSDADVAAGSDGALRDALDGGELMTAGQRRLTEVPHGGTVMNVKSETVMIGGGHCCQCSQVCNHIGGPWFCATHQAADANRREQTLEDTITTLSQRLAAAAAEDSALAAQGVVEAARELRADLPEIPTIMTGSYAPWSGVRTQRLIALFAALAALSPPGARE